MADEYAPKDWTWRPETRCWEREVPTVGRSGVPSGTHVERVTEQFAAAHRILSYKQESPPLSNIPHLPGYRWTGEFYERIGNFVQHQPRCSATYGRTYCTCGAR